MLRYCQSAAAGGYHFANAGPGIGWGGLCLLLLALLCPNTAEAIEADLYADGPPDQIETLERPSGVGLFSGTQSQAIQAYCDGLNISDYNCRRISRILFAEQQGLQTPDLAWDSNHTGLGSGDSNPPYYNRWGDARMVASPETGPGGNYYCMSLFFDPPLPSGWDMEFRWTVGAGGRNIGAAPFAAVDVRFRQGTDEDSNIIRTDVSGQFRENRSGGATFLPWTKPGFSNFSSAVPEVRWCMFTANIFESTFNRARIDGVLFGTDDGEEFCRPGLNAGDESCVSGHDDFIDSYCTALGLSSRNCQLVSRLAFNRSGIGEHVWDPTHDQASAGGGSSSVLSPPVKGGEYSCMSLYFDRPNPQGVEFSFAWDLSRRAAYSGESGRGDAYMRFFFFAAGAGADHDPADLATRGSDAFARLGTEGSGFAGWRGSTIGNPATEAGELKWCYYGGNSDVGEVDRGRVDRLQVEELPVSESTDGRVVIETHCTALNIEDELCTRVSHIAFQRFNAGPAAWDPDHAMGAVPGDMLSVASQQVGAGDYSCLSLYFSEEPIARGSDISFQWAVGRGAGSGSSSLLFWPAPTGDDRLPTVDLGQPGISQSQLGFSAWMEHSAVAIDRPVPDLRWCYFGTVSSAGEMDFGRVDRLEVVEGIGVSFVLPEPNPGPGIVEGETAVVVVRSGVALEAGDTVSIRLRAEEDDGNRFLDPNGTNVVAEDSLPGRLVFEYTLVGDGTMLEHSLELPTRDDNRPEPGSIIRLALLDPPPTAGYRVSAPSSGWLIAVEDSRRQVMEYCAALNIPAALCDRMSGIVFADSASPGRAWDAEHGMGAVPGDMLSVASPSVRDGEYSCLTLHFSEPILRGSDISFQWALGRESSGGASRLLVWFALTADDQPPTVAFEQPSIARVQRGFSDWIEHSSIAIDRVVPEIRWCHFGANPSPGEMDIGRIDRLAVAEGIAISFALPEPNPGPATVEGAAAVVLVRSPIAVEAGRTVMIRLLVEEGERFIDPDGPNVVTEVSLPGRLVLELPLTGDGNTLERALMLPTRDDDRPEPGSNIRLTLVEPQPGAGYRVSTPSSGYLIAVKDNRLQIMDYCAALNMQMDLCARLSSVIFANGSAEERAWNAGHPAGAVPGDSLSVASPSVGAGDYSCMSLHFSEPLVAGSDISFRWSLGRGAGGDSNSISTLLVWFAPTAAQQQPMLDLGQPGISQDQAGFSAWMEHSVVPIDRAVPEIRWCYFGVDPNPGEMDIGRIDRLEVIEGGRIRFVLPEPNPGPAVAEGTTVSVIVRSEVAVEAGRTVSIRLLAEEDERFIDSNRLNVVAEASTSGRLVLEFPLTGDGSTLEHALMLPIRDDNRFATAGTIRLSLSVPLPGARYRVSTPSSGYLIVVKDNRRLIMEYCAALNMSAALCDRVSGIVFAENGSGERRWNARHSVGAVLGDSLSVASPIVSNGNYSCMSMYFDEPLIRGSDISFYLAAGRGQSGGNSLAVAWIAPREDQPPTYDATQLSIGKGMPAGFSAWVQRSVVAIDRSVPEIRWCYFGASASPDHRDIGRFDRLVVAEGTVISLVLPEPNPGPAIVEGTTAVVLVRSTIAFADGDRVLIRLLVTEGERFIDLDGPNVLAEISLPGRLVIELPLIGDGNALEHALMLPTRDDDRPEPGSNIRLALAEPQPGAGYRVSTPSSGYLIAVKDNRLEIMDYCNALNIRVDLCARLSSIIFANGRAEDRSWNARHSVGAVPGDSLSAASPSVGAGDYSCLSLHFSEPIARGSDISFQWAPGRGTDGGTSSMLVWFAPTDADQPPKQDPGQPGISRRLSGFSDWMGYSAMPIDRVVPEIRWCYFGISLRPGEMDIGRIDRLAVTESIAISFVLPEPNPGPAIVEGTTAVVLVRSPIALEAGRTVMIRLLVEEGERFIDLDGPNAVAEVSTAAQLVLQYTLTGDGNVLEHALILPTRDDNRPEEGGNIRLALVVPLPAAGYRLGTPSSGYLIAVKANRLQIMDYCNALNMQVDLCARLSSVVFANGGSERRVWSASHQEGAVPGDDRSAASPSVGAGDYSCLSLHFSEPLVAGSDISFQWSLGRGAGGDTASSTLLVWLAPTADEQPPMLTLGQTGILRGQAGFSDWMGYLAMAVDRAVPEIRWCYFGVNPSPGEMDIGRIDRLEVIEGGRIRFVLPEPNPGLGTVEGTAASIIVRSEVAVEAGRTVIIRLLAEGGQRFLDPNGPNVLAEVSMPGRLVFELPLTGDGSTLEHALMLPTRDDNRPESGGNIRLTLIDPPPGAKYRVSTPSSGYLIAVQDNRRQVMEYCDALNLAAGFCARVFSVVFTENGSGERAWDAGHQAAARPGDRLSVASPTVGNSGYSCLSLHFSEPIVAGSDISFQWALGRGSSGGPSSLLVWFAPTADEQPPMNAPGPPRISQIRAGFSDWMKYSAMAIDRPVPEIRWCYFGVRFSVGTLGFGRIDQLEVAEGNRIRFVLPEPNPGPAIVEGMAAEIVVRSEVAVEAGRTVSIRLLVEEGQRFIDPNGPNVVAEVSTPGQLVLELPLTGDGSTLEHVLLLPTQDDNRPGPGGNIRLALAEPQPGAGYRVSAPSSGYLIAVKDNRRLIMEYCAALNMPAALCDRVSSIIFANSSTENRTWDARHSEGAVLGDSLSVASPSVGEGDYSCMSMYFAEPIVRGSDISFQWSLGRGADGGDSSSTMLVWLAPTGADQPPMLTLRQPRILREQDGFSAWMEHSAVAIDRPVPEIRWCYFGGSPSPGEMDIGRIDRLVVAEDIALSFVLPEPNPGPAIAEGTTAVVLVRSKIAFADGDSVLIRLLVEEGERFLDPKGPNVLAEVSTPTRLVLQYTLTGDGSTLEHVLLLPLQDDNRLATAGTMRLSLPAPSPGAGGYRVSTPSSGYLIAVKDNRRLIMEYCAALNMPTALCDRVSGIVFAENGSGERVWNARHSEGAVLGDSLSVASPSVGEGDYSCLSLHFSEPILAGSDISFQWSLGRGAGGGDSSSTMLVWLAPTGADQPPMLALGPPRILREQDGFSAWMEHSAVTIDRPVPEIRWCYFGGSPSPGEMDIGRIDRLVVAEDIALSFVLPEPNPGPAIVEGMTAVVLVRSITAFAAGDSVLIRLLVEEGERFIDLAGPNVLAEELPAGRLVLEFLLTGDGTTLEHALMLPTQDDNRPEQGGNIRLALAEPLPGVGYRLVTPSSGYLIAVKDNRRLIMEYCAALNMPAALCDRVSDIVFVENGSGERVWVSGHPAGAVPGDSLSVASPSVGAGGYSCMSLRFSDPLAFGSDIFFQWSLGRGAGGGGGSSSLLVWLAPTPDDQPPMLTLGQTGILRGQAGFSDWMGYSAMAIDRAVPEVRWCYFGGNPGPGETDIGRIDRLTVSEGIAINFVLPEPNPGPAVVEGTTAVVLVRSNIAVKADSTVMIRLLVEEGERFIDPKGPNVVAEVSMPGRLVLELPLTGDGSTLEHVLMLPIWDDNRLATAGTIRLSLAAPPSGVGYRVSTPSSGYLIAVKDNRRLIMEYCAALNMPTALCDRVSGIVFAENGSGERVWNARHPEGAVPGDMLSVASPSVGEGDYSCMSMYFAEPIVRGSDISCQWSLGRGAGGDTASSTMLVWLAPTAADQPPMLTLRQPSISREQDGFSAWMEHSAVAIDRPVSEIRWCYFGGSPSPDEMDIGRIDRLVVVEDIALSFVLPEPNPGPAIVEGTTAVVFVRSTVALAAGDSVLIRLLVEEGERFLDPKGPNVFAEVSTPARLVLQYTLTGDGSTLEHVLLLPTRDDNRPGPGGNIRLALAEPQPGAGYRVSTPSSSYLIAVKDNRLQIMDYCAALNMQVDLCARLSSVVFANGSAEERAWNAGHPAGAVPGDSLSVASPSVGEGDYSCMSMYFAEPIVRGSDISFQWSLGRGADGGDSSSTMLVWLAPTPDDQPPMLTLGQTGILRGQAGFSDWMGYSAMAIDRAVPEIRWCYFGGNPSPGEMDVGRIDRLVVAEDIALSFVLPEPNPGPAIAEGTTAVVFVRSTVALADGDSILIRLLVEEGERFIDPKGPNVFAEVSTPERLVLQYTLTGDGSKLEHVLMLPLQDDNRLATAGTIRLSLPVPSAGAGYRVSTPSSGYLIAVKDNRRLIMEYCAALNMSAVLCDRVSGIVFAENGSGERVWNARHSEGAVLGDSLSVASPSVGEGDYSCLSLHFSEPILAGSDISFRWSLGRGAGGGDSSSTMLVWFAPTGADQPPMQDLGQPSISREQDGFSAWMEHSAVAIDRPLLEIRWCYFGGSPSPGEVDIGRIDRLVVAEDIALSFVLPEPNPGPAIVEGTTAVVLVRSRIAVEANSTVMIRLLVEEGQRFIDRGGPNVVAEVSTPGRLVLELPLTGDGRTLEHVLLLPTRDDNRPEQGGNIRLALAEPLPGAGYRVSTPSSGYLIAVKDNRRLIMEYCAALNMSAALCDRVSGIVFAENESGERAWNAGHPAGAVPGDSLSVASPSVGEGDYSCMSMYFAEPIVRGSDISFQWSLGRGADGGDSSSTMLVWLAPTPDDQPPMLTLGQTGILRGQAGFSDWMGYSAVAIDRPVPEIRWCYFGGSPSPGEMDIGRIDRLVVAEDIALSFVLPEPNPGPAIAEGTTAVVLVRSKIAFADGDSVLIRLLVEEGERFIDPKGPNVLAEVSTPERLVLQYTLTGDGSTLEHVLMLPIQDDNRLATAGTIRLSLPVPSPGAGGYRVSTPSSGYLIAVKDNRRLIMEYCAALNMSTALCDRVSGIVFAENGSGERVWNARHSEGAVLGDMLSVASPSVGEGDYSCMSMYFAEPIVRGSDISFQWSLGRGADGGDSSSTMLVWLAPTGADQPPMLTLRQPRILREQDGFSAWMEHSAVAIDRPVPEIRWCYFGGSPSPGEMDIGRIDRLVVAEDIALSFVLPEPNPGPAIVEGTTAVVFVRSTVALAAGDSVLIRLLVEEGERFLDPKGPNVVAEVSTPGRLVLELPLTGDGSTLEHVLLLPTRDDNRPGPGGNIRLALAEPQPGAGYRVSTPSSGYLIAVKDNRRLIMDYCAALNMSAALCDRVSGIVFAENESGERAWNAGHLAGAVLGDSLSVASPSVGEGDYSCMSMYFAEPIVRGSDISFQWSLGRGADGGDSSSTMLVWLAPTGADQPPMLTLRQPRILQDQDGFSAWMEHSAVAIDRPVPEIRWCYFGGSPSPGEMDIGRIDRLVVAEDIALSFVLPEPNPGPAIAEGTTAVVFVRSKIAFADGDSVLIRLLVEEGERFIDPKGPNVLAEVSTPTRLVLQYTLTGDGSTLEHVLLLPLQDDNRLATAGTIRLSLPAPPPGAGGYRVSTPSSGYLIAVKDNRRLIMEYCAALNMPAALCDRVSDIVFVENGSEERAWISDHPEGAVPGDMLSVASPSVGEGDYSCMSMYFAEPIVRGSDISFQWSLGRGAGGGDSSSSSTMLVWFAPTADEQPPMQDLGQPSILQGQAGFSAWMEHSAVAIDRPVPEIRWCYFGGNLSPGEMDIGRIDRLVVAEDIALSFVLPEPNPGPAIVEGTTAAVLVRSKIAFADGDSVLIRLLVEEGERFLDPKGPNVVAEVSTPARFVLQYTLTGDGSALEHVLLLPILDDDLAVPGGRIRLALVEPPPEAGYRLGTPSGGYLIAIEDNDYRPNAEGLIRWWQLLLRCEESGSGCPTPSGSVPTLPNSPGLTMRTEDELGNISAVFQALLDNETLDVNRDMSYDTMDLRIILRYLAGLRGEALVESGTVDEARLQAFER